MVGGRWLSDSLTTGLVGVRKQASGAPVERNPNEMVIRGTVALLPEVTPFPGFKKRQNGERRGEICPSLNWRGRFGGIVVESGFE